MILNSPISKISYQIPFQFPQLYREEAEVLIQLVQSYYEFLETQQNQGIYHSRMILDSIDIDRTSQQMLIFFQKKYLPNFPVNEENIRFLVKNITDLYRRKGSEEGLRLFFKMFYETNIEVYYPKNDIIKPSSSTWKTGNFIQLYPVTNPLAFSDLLGLKIYGALSKAEAYVDAIQFVNVYGSSIPIIFLDKTKGTFVGLETIYTTDPIRKNYGRIYGSLDNIINITGITANNRVGDIVDVYGEKGYGAKAIVTDISDTISGEINFEIVDGDFGYTLSSNTVLLISNQNLIVDNIYQEFILEEKVGQDIGGNTWVYGTVIGQNVNTLGIKLDDANSSFISNSPLYTIDRDENITKDIFLAGVAQLDVDSATAEVGEISNTIEIDIVTDIIQDYIDVVLNSTNYNDSPAEQPMSGNTNPINLSTPLIDAFGPQKITIGSISKLTNVSPGNGYENNIFVLVKENRIKRFDIKNQILGFNSANTPFVISTGDIIRQEREITDFSGNTFTAEITGKVVDIRNDALYIKPKSFYEFVLPAHLTSNTDIMIYKEGVDISPIDVVSISRDDDSYPMGYNAIISAIADYELGRIEGLKIINSGIAYEHQSNLTFKNPTRWKRDFDSVHNLWDPESNIPEPVYEDFVSTSEGFGEAVARGQGKSEGYWVSKSSHLNYTDGKKIQDSNFYQDYSYEVAMPLPEQTFLPSLQDLVHPVGLKFFSKFSLLETINIDINLTSDIEQRDI